MNTIGNASDYSHPFADRVNRETAEEAIERVVSIGLEGLKAWWSRVKSDTHPATFGATGTELASSVAYMAAGGRVARSCADETAPRFEVARQLEIVINWV